MSFSLKSIVMILLNFLIVSVAWIFFRADSISIAFEYINNILQFSGGGNFYRKTNTYLIITISAIIGILIMILIEYFAIRKKKPEVNLPSFTLVCLVVLICILGVFKDQSEFIYFQF